eukprot:6008916-Ditylum_brightwellii.AAC.1
MGDVCNLYLEGITVAKESKINQDSVNLTSKFIGFIVGVGDEMLDIGIIFVIIGINIPNDVKAELNQIFLCKERLFAMRSPIFF